MKKSLGIIVAAIVVIVLLALLGAGLGFGLGPGKGGGDGEGEGASHNDTPTSAEEVNNNEAYSSEEETTVVTTASTEDSTEESRKTMTIAVSVFESDYLYQNKKILLDDLIKELESIEEGFIVEVTDDNASLKAYNKLIDMLEAHGIRYTEK